MASSIVFFTCAILNVRSILIPVENVPLSLGTEHTSDGF